MSGASLLLVLDLGGTLAFAIYGALSGIRVARLDVLGVLILGLLTAIGGGLMRDAILGATPANAFADWRYPATAIAGSLIAYLASRWLARAEPMLVFFDAVGMGFFAVSGAGKALVFGASPLGAVLLGVLTAVGGGALRDVMIRRMPSILYKDLYGTSALLGALIVVVGAEFGVVGLVPATVGVLAAVALRLAATRWNWSAPTVPRSGFHQAEGHT